ncbi:hypothetical protein Fmac_003785 [Flemingia macrophylla]|uniref:Cytochrome P450 n=1 Tax=Flemingia macrophylla TaxID=520843 RepID=A0ABD1N5N2_9FABA
MFDSIMSATVIVFAFIFIVSAILLGGRKVRKDGERVLPSPSTIPILGNLHMLGKLPHHTLEALAKRYGPIMFLKLGQVPTIVVSSADSAENFLKSHDHVFSSRPTHEANTYLDYGTGGLAFSKYGAYWSNMRKFCTIQLLSASKVDSFEPLRKKELQQAVNFLQKAAMDGRVVDLSEVEHNVIEDFVYKMVLGRNKDGEFDLKGLIQKQHNLLGAFNIADYVPWLGLLDLQGLKREFKKTSKALDLMLEKIIKEHERVDVQNGQHEDFVDILLSLMHQPLNPYDEQSQIIERTNIKAILLDMIAGAFETAATIVEWALAELLRDPRVMKNLQDELDNVVGRNRLVEESDLEKLSYLDIVIKETFRLHPAGPLVPRESIEDATVHGYFIKKNTSVLINLRAIGRDPKIWSDNAEMFYPERFINNSLDYRGHNLQFIPFGFGRRGCPGMLLGLTTVKLVVAQLMHCFSWELPGNLASEELDMTEKFGLTTPRLHHLLAVPTYRLLSQAI